MPTIDSNTFRPSHLTKYFTRNLALAWGIVAISTFNYAFDQQGFNSTQAMNPFAKTFGTCSMAKGSKKTVCNLEPYYLSLLNSLVYIGFAFGAWIGSLISARYGRRMCIFCMSLWALVTATILVTSGVTHNKWQLLAGRVLNYIYIGMELASVPVYQSEIVPAPIRGFAVGSYQLSLGVGGLIINIICRGTSEIKNNNSWMIPYGCYYIIPTFIACTIWRIPESPRWLLMKGRDAEALASLIKLRGEGNEAAATEELELIRIALSEEADKGTYADLLKGHNRRRTFLVCGIAFFFQATGQVFSGHYGAVFVKSLNIVSNPLTITVSQTALNTVTSFIGILMLDRVGRRPLWLVGSFILMASLLIMGGLGVQQPNPYSHGQGIIAMMLIFQMAYVATIGPIYYTMIAEIPASRLRDKTVRVGATVNIVTVFVISFTLPYLQSAPYANLGSQVGFIYGSMSFLSLVFGYFFVPELKNRSLEEVETMFATKMPIRSFGAWQSKTYDVGTAISRVEENLQEKDGVKRNVSAVPSE